MAKIDDKSEPIESPRPMTLEELRQLGGRVVGDIVEPIDEWDMMIEPTRAKTLEEMRAEGVKILGDIMEPLDWNMTADPVNCQDLDPPPPRRHRTLDELHGSVKIRGDIVESHDDEWDTTE